jgi:hypothetical protein
MTSDAAEWHGRWINRTLVGFLLVVGVALFTPVPSSVTTPALGAVAVVLFTLSLSLAIESQFVYRLLARNGRR